MCDQRADFWLKKSGLGLPTVEGEYKQLGGWLLIVMAQTRRLLLVETNDNQGLKWDAMACWHFLCHLDSLLLITSAKEVMFLSDFVCLSVYV